MITKFYGKKRPKYLLIKVVYYNLLLNLIILDVTAQNSYPTSLMCQNTSNAPEKRVSSPRRLVIDATYPSLAGGRGYNVNVGAVGQSIRWAAVAISVNSKSVRYFSNFLAAPLVPT